MMALFPPLGVMPLQLPKAPLRLPQGPLRLLK